jgi:hypothetical protein
MSGLAFASSVLAAFLLAAAALRVLMMRPPPHRSNGVWRIDLSLGSERAGLYGKAFTAWHSLFALRVPESIYFSANRDCEGNRLECGNTYSIEGHDPDTRWWSLTAYKKNHLIPNPARRYSFSQTTVARYQDGSWKIRLSPSEQAENWLPSGKPEGRLGLILRLYGPSHDVLSRPWTIPLPVIRKEKSA